ncbi:hypothetical protein [uncultured Mobiluncus sp.]|uniref:hypothetical protein n=1 Tax=uncultured Mobiluncus sp. TaxID=293425 RepID=UPI0026380CC3|nr:hypothetical protein [uncultured Mobiluncus sp.]
MSETIPDTKQVGVIKLLTKVIDIMRGKETNNVIPEPIELRMYVDGIEWVDMEAEKLKEFFRQWELFAADADEDAYEYADAENHILSAYNEGYRDGILDLIDDICAVFARMSEPELDLDGWHK